MKTYIELRLRRAHTRVDPDAYARASAWWHLALTEATYDDLGQPVLSAPYWVFARVGACRTQDVADVAAELGAASESELKLILALAAEHEPAMVGDIENLLKIARMEAELL